MNVTNQGNNFDGDSNAARSVATGPHPRVYAGLIGFAILFALAVWSFAGSGVTDYLLFIICGFAVALPLILSRVWRADGQDREPSSLRNWAESDFETWQDRLSGAQAALHVLLPIGIAAIVMTAFGIAFHIASTARNGFTSTLRASIAAARSARRGLAARRRRK